MNPNVHRILLDADDPENAEFSPGFDYNRALEKVLEAKGALEALYGREFTLDRNVQDATYFASLTLEKSEEIPLPHSAVVIGVLFSSFGNLVTVTGNAKTGGLSYSLLSETVSRLESLGFCFVDAKNLDEPYDGPNPAFHGASWRHRFFDYL
jgi:hypothetical protein